MEESSKKQRLVGTVVSDKMQKTVVVQVSHKKRHAKYHKTYTVSKRYKAHDETGQYHTGDTVVIESTRPMSKGKSFIVVGKA